MTDVQADRAVDSYRAADVTRVVFAGQCFCFTGTMASLKRSAAEREVRARGGQAVDTVNAQLDYLVVGHTPSRGWAHGNFGRKIESARTLRDGGAARPRILSEGTFLDALAAAPATNDGALDAQVVVVNVKLFLESRTAADISGVEAWLATVAREHTAHVTVAAHTIATYDALFAEASDGPRGRPSEVVTCRIARQLPLTENPGAFADMVSRGFERLQGMDTRVRWFTRTEGSADYVRLLREIPLSLQVPGL